MLRPSWLVLPKVDMSFKDVEAIDVLWRDFLVLKNLDVGFVIEQYDNNKCSIEHYSLNLIAR